MTYRSLTPTEQEQLERQGCSSDNWQWISVKDNFTASKIRRTHFSGHVQIGKLNGHDKPEGIHDSTIDNCTLEDHVLVSQVGRLSHYIVRSHAVIENCGTIEAIGKSTFGNGTRASVINEAGGREVPLYEGLTAQTAWLMAFMRHRKNFTEQFTRLIDEKCSKALLDNGIIGHHARVSNCNTITNVYIGDHARVEGSLHLKNGTINSTESAPTRCGHGVMAENFMMAAGSVTNNASIVKNSFIGQGCIVDRQFSADHTVCFANSQLYHGEACSAFCAPYTVSHHKSTLLIAGYFAFMNAGSGSNQSNHMYKLGPVHQGVTERGCKLSSDSYLLWPAKIGAFTFVMGRHYSNPDIGDFPFSYLLDEEGISSLVPGANFRSIGTLRDSDKWPGRDIRTGTKADRIHYNMLHAYTVSKALKGKQRLTAIEQNQEAPNGYYTIGDVRIKKPALRRGIDIYNEIATIYTGNIIDRISKERNLSIEQLVEEIRTHGSIDTFGWVDMAGMLMPEYKLMQLVNEVESGQLASLSKIDAFLDEAFDQSPQDEWQWVLSRWDELTGMSIVDINADKLSQFMQNSHSAHQRFTMMLVKDAQKEYSERSKISFGYNDDPKIRFDEFTAIRGTCDDNSFVQKLKQESK